MCLISFNWLNHPVYKLILVANRDEFFDRQTNSLHRWPSGFYAGKDLRGGGTWMGVHPKGKFAALTNFRHQKSIRQTPISRGKLVKGFLECEDSPFEYLEKLQENMHRYDGFNLLVANSQEMGYLSNHRQGIQKVGKGVHGISNAFLDTPWPKVDLAKRDLADLIFKEEFSIDALMGTVQSRDLVPDEQLPNTGISLAMERELSAQFIRKGDEYGTVNTTVVLWKHDGEVVIQERRTVPPKETKIAFKILHHNDV